ncbi:ZIP family zinc transporter [Orenia metallireducens]|jgi:ZIP family zinc transporter|uniref:Zinc transporter, ZIP family n=1 Tax=Orenia metallireducens TaxID=1413210 RepID=A0A285FXR6_9FIRM|nr:ZIP family metal transporter [Orenia metallireducens]PRX35554.1 ZIP family zinc transporter [Orenia metallireducens]SNY16067.1 zinc transporter, ZIP family [Orenia metallireducens]
MNSIVLTTAIGLLAGMLGTGLGGVVTFFWRKPTNKSVSFLLGVAGGIMLAIVMVDLVPESIHHSSLAYAVSGLLLGFILLSITSKFFRKYIKGEEYIHTGVLLGLGISMHNFPEGLAIGAGYIATAELGFGLAIVMAFHNFPEGLSMATPMNVGGWSPIRIFIATLLPGIPMGIGAFCGSLIGYISPEFLSVTLGFAGGGMLYLTLFELIPSSYNFDYGLDATLGIIVGLGTGAVLTFLF